MSHSDDANIVRKEFAQVEWDAAAIDDFRHLVRLAVREDLDRRFDLTTLALVSDTATGSANVVSRQPGVAAGLVTVPVLLDEMNIRGDWRMAVADGDTIAAGTILGAISGPTRDLLTAERPLLNFIGRLAGIASLTRRYVDATAGTGARVYDTRKTTPGWRRLEKYAVRCGGGTNHRTGLFDAVLIKDNHLAHAQLNPADAITQARDLLARAAESDAQLADAIVEVEVDTLVQLDAVLPLAPDIVLLDNMTLDNLREAVRRRDTADVATELEASGGVTLDTVRSIAETGVDRISVGALTHSAISLDIGLDWATATHSPSGTVGP